MGLVKAEESMAKRVVEAIVDLKAEGTTLFR